MSAITWHAALAWVCLAFVLAVIVMTSVPQRKPRLPTYPAPRNCRVLRGDFWTVGKARYRFGDWT